MTEQTVTHYAITVHGRQLIGEGLTDEEAQQRVHESYYLRKTTKRIVRTIEETVYEHTPA